jgi:hypothetical protein
MCDICVAMRLRFAVTVEQTTAPWPLNVSICALEAAIGHCPKLLLGQPDLSCEDVCLLAGCCGCLRRKRRAREGFAPGASILLRLLTKRLGCHLGRNSPIEDSRLSKGLFFFFIAVQIAVVQPSGTRICCQKKTRLNTRVHFVLL